MKPSFLIILGLSLTPCLPAQGLMESATLIMEAQLEEDLRQAHQDEIRSLSVASISMSGYWQLPQAQYLSGEEVAPFVDAVLEQRSNRETMEAKCPEKLAEKIRDEYEPAKMSIYAQLQPSLRHNARDATYIEQLRRLLPEGMPDEQERTRLRDAIAELVARDFELLSCASKLLSRVTDEPSASACAEAFKQLMLESQALGPELMTCDGRWLTKEDKELISAPFTQSTPAVYPQLYGECQRILAAHYFGSEAMQAVFKSLRIAGSE